MGDVVTNPIDWPSLRRVKPDPSAPTTPSQPFRSLYGAVATAGTIAALPPVVVLTMIKHKIYGPPTGARGWMPMRAEVFMRVVQLVLCRFVWAMPGVDRKEWDLHAIPDGVECKQVTIQPARAPRTGFAVCDAVEGVARPGFILSPKDAEAKGWDKALPGEKAILYFVGGGYAFGHPLERPFAGRMAKKFGVRVLAVNYRKVLNSSQAFPAPLLDALAGWEYLTNNLGFEASNITISGESAGGNLSLLLTRYLADLDTPLPGALALSSPWCDMGPDSHKRNSMTANYFSDYLPWFGAKAARSAARHYAHEARRTAYFAPVHATKEEWAHLKDVNVYVQAGSGEILVDEIRITVKNMRSAGVEVAYVEEPGGVHIAPSFVLSGSEAWHQWRDDVGPLVKGTTAEVKGWPVVRPSWAEANEGLLQ